MTTAELLVGTGGDDWLADFPELRELDVEAESRCCEVWTNGIRCWYDTVEGQRRCREHWRCGAPRADGEPCRGKPTHDGPCWRHKPESAPEMTEPPRRVHRVKRSFPKS